MVNVDVTIADADRGHSDAHAIVREMDLKAERHAALGAKALIAQPSIATHHRCSRPRYPRAAVRSSVVCITSVKSLFRWCEGVELAAGEY